VPCAAGQVRGRWGAEKASHGQPAKHKRAEGSGLSEGVTCAAGQARAGEGGGLRGRLMRSRLGITLFRSSAASLLSDLCLFLSAPSTLCLPGRSCVLQDGNLTGKPR